MTYTGYVFTGGVMLLQHFTTYLCLGKINLPPSGNTVVVFPGNDVVLAWTFDANIDHVKRRYWRILSSWEILGTIFHDGSVGIQNSSLPALQVKKPATLILKNVSIRYNGTYRFYLTSVPYENGTRIEENSDVALFVAAKPNVTTNCSRTVELDEGDDMKCLCTGEGGNPPTSLTWNKDGVRIGYIKYEKNLLIIRNIGKNDSGRYNCIGESHSQKEEKSIQVIVSFPPAVTRLTAIPKRPLLGKPVIIWCDAIAVPGPNYVIIHNDSVLVSTEKTYLINTLDYSHVGLYSCLATNDLGNSSSAYNLSVIDAEKSASSKVGCESEWYIFPILLVSGIIIGIFLICIGKRLLCCLKDASLPAKSEVKSSTDVKVDCDWNETEMGLNENLQSRGINSDGSDEAYYENIYTQLNAIRDTENNYQGLIQG